MKGAAVALAGLGACLFPSSVGGEAQAEAAPPSGYCYALADGRGFVSGVEQMRSESSATAAWSAYLVDELQQETVLATRCVRSGDEADADVSLADLTDGLAERGIPVVWTGWTLRQVEQAAADALNSEVNRRNEEVRARNDDAAAAYAKAQAEYEARQQAYREAELRHRAEVAATEAAKRSYEQNLLQWRQRVAACAAGDHAQCAAPAP